MSAPAIASVTNRAFRTAGRQATLDLPPDLLPAETTKRLLKHMQFSDGPDNDTSEVSETDCSLELCEWLKSQRPLPPSVLAAEAAQHGHTAVVDWVQTHHPQESASTRACSFSAARGYLPALKVLRSTHPPWPWDADAIYSAAGFGHFDIL
ncbi:hypothetical protein WJX84_001613 [Apatococcus fuscideae]|uniref:Ankyrin repeat protein n=1 Tax=Apatococcus fuscideae TaxID=2026836 RepID=A0AAW1TAC4_9CHLO